MTYTTVQRRAIEHYLKLSDLRLELSTHDVVHFRRSDGQQFTESIDDLVKLYRDDQAEARRASKVRHPA